MKNWEELPENIRKEEVRRYYNILVNKKKQIRIKRIFDYVVAWILLVLVSPIMAVIGIMVKCDSPGPIIFTQTRITQYGRRFHIYKFRTMCNQAEKKGTQVTTNNDARITKVGKVLRKYRLDELPQLFNIILGDMSFVGTRPEVEKYVRCYTNEMKATLLMPAGITSLASVTYKDEERLLGSAENADQVYIQKILPSKMEYNLNAIQNFSLLSEIKVIIYTVWALIKY